jgi:hypothetical protein
MNVTDWGVVEVVPGTRKHLKLDGKEWALTATPLANGNFAVLVEEESNAAARNSPAGAPLGMLGRHTQNMILPGNVEVLTDVDQKPVRLTLKLKTS